jgi:adenine-specific DNA-methyltransferase
MKVPLPPPSGSVGTPTVLAEGMVAAIDDGLAATWLDPCVGDGVFVRAVRSRGGLPEKITALDLNLKPGETDQEATTIRGVDFVSWSGITSERFDRIVMNPPYVGFARLSRTLQDVALDTARRLGWKVNLRTNYWYFFLLASLHVLRPGGSLAAVLPAAWEFADYASPLRSELPTRFGSIERHRAAKPLFDSVRDGCVVLVCRNHGAAPRHSISLDHRSLDDLAQALEGSNEPPGARVRGKSQQLPGTRIASKSADTVSLGKILRIRLGAVTGDSRYFLMSDGERRERNLPVAACKPAVTHARHVLEPYTTPQVWRRLRDAGERVWLFKPTPGVLSHPGVSEYLALGPNEGGCDRSRFKVRTREPWYSVPLPPPADGFLTGMSKFAPWLSIRTMPSLTASNTLYGLSFRSKLSKDEKAAWALSVLSEDTRAQVRRVGRRYGQGLIKLEPSDLHRLRVRVPGRTLGAARYYAQALPRFLSGDERVSQEIRGWLES